MTDSDKGTALVTGASSGIGSVYAERLARRGHDVVLVARDRTRLEALADRITRETGRVADVLVADLSTADGIASVAARLGEDASIRVLVNNAGLSLKGDLLDNSPAEIDRIIAVNVSAPTHLSMAAAKSFATRKAGAIINISSVLALAPEQSGAAYSGSKGYLLNLSIKLAALLETANVRVQAVLPGATRTEIWERSGKDVDALAPGRVMDAEELVDAALVGFDLGEVVTIPPLADEAQWAAYDDARRAMAPNLSSRHAAARYHQPAAKPAG